MDLSMKEEARSSAAAAASEVVEPPLAVEGGPKEEGDAEDETAALTDLSTTSLSTNSGTDQEGSVSSLSQAGDAKPRSSFATRQTVEELESRVMAKQQQQAGGCAASCNCAGTKPGAVAVAGVASESSLSLSSGNSSASSLSERERVHDNNHTIETSNGHVVLNIENDEDDTNCNRQQPTAPAEIPLIHARLAEEPPLAVQAELVLPPPVALRVEFDEEAPPELEPGIVPADGTRPTPVPPGTGPPLLDDPTDDLKAKVFSRRNMKRVIRCHVFLLVLGLILGIVIPKLQENEAMLEQEFEDIAEDDYHFAMPFASPVMLSAPVVAPSDWSAPPPTPAPVAASGPTPQPSVLSVYECFKTTLDLAIAQVENPADDGRYILCPNIRYKMGSYNENYTSIEEGDIPLTALRDSIEIRCGLDGRRDNHCYMDGGFLHVALNPPTFPNETLIEGAMDRTVDNVTFRGITFTGELNTTGDPSYPSGTSVFINQPGRNISFIDCSWENIVAPNGVAQIGGDGSTITTAAPSTTEDGNSSVAFAAAATVMEPTMGVTFENCSFSNIEYGGGGSPLISVFGQEATLRRCRFEDVSLSESLSSCVLSGNSMEWCQGLLYCLDHSRCELSDICVDGLEFAGPGAIATTSRETDLTVTGSMFTEEVVAAPGLSFLNCSSGLAMFGDEEFSAPECWDDAVDVFMSNGTSSSDFCGY